MASSNSYFRGYFGSPSQDETVEDPAYTLEPLTSFNDMTAREPIRLRTNFQPAVDLNEPVEPPFRLEQRLPDLSPELKAAKAAEKADRPPIAVVAPPPTAPADTKPVTEVLKAKPKDMEAAGKSSTPESDEMGRLRRMLALQQFAEAAGSAASGKNLYTSGEPILERMKQIEALRLKREEKAQEEAKARAEAAAMAGVTSQTLKDLGITAPAGLAALPSPELVLKAGKFAPEIAGMQALAKQRAAAAGKTEALLPGQVEGQAARVDETKAKTKSRTYTDALTQARRQSELERRGLIAAQAEATRAKIELDKAKAAGSGDVDPKTVNARQKLVDAYQKAYLNPAASLAAVEEKAPGLTKGKPPAWLTGDELSLVRNNATYNLASDDTKDVFAAAQKYLDGYRKNQYGSALTATEQAELQRLVAADIFTGADKLTRFFNLIRKDIATTFQNKLQGDRLVQQAFVDKYVGSEDSPLAAYVGPKGLFSDVWTLKKPEAAPAAGAPASGTTVLIRQKSTQTIRRIPADKAANFLAQPDFEEVK